jgi:alkanesulfonate monooxygenase SsuD/methylene tetrahydromethanopterin reductase-like flavin-dependent oxidoreductase (luciferase family)
MRFGISLSTIGDYSDPALLASLAREAEGRGWDGCFVWDHIQARLGDPVADPWIALSAIAVATARIRIGTLVTPLYRRRPWKLARETATLDRLSAGRLVLGVGLGSDMFHEISAFAGPMEDRLRAELLDEGLAVLTGLWSGKLFAFEGKHFKIHTTRFLPTPVQMPRIPIWVAGTWPKRPPFRRAARFDGVIPVCGDMQSSLLPAQLRELVAYVKQVRGTGRPFDVVFTADTPGEGDEDRQIVAAYTDAGATWWLESILPQRLPSQARDRIRRGPPRI